MQLHSFYMSGKGAASKLKQGFGNYASHDFKGDAQAKLQLLRELNGAVMELSRGMKKPAEYRQYLIFSAKQRLDRLRDIIDNLDRAVELQAKPRVQIAEKLAREITTIPHKAEQVEAKFIKIEEEILEMQMGIVAIEAVPIKKRSKEKSDELTRLKERKKGITSSAEYTGLKSELWRISRTLPEFAVRYPEVFPLHGTAAQGIPIRSFEADYKEVEILFQNEKSLVLKASRNGTQVCLKQYNLNA